LTGGSQGVVDSVTVTVTVSDSVSITVSDGDESYALAAVLVMYPRRITRWRKRVQREIKEFWRNVSQRKEFLK
jgi:hypothetical protein